MMLKIQNPTTLLPEAKAIEVAGLSNHADPDWDYVAEPLPGNAKGLWVVKIFDEDCEFLGYL